MWALGSPALRALTTRQLEGLGERRETAPAAGAAGGGVEVEPRWQALRRRYDLGEELGSGGGGAVYAGVCKQGGGRVAIKAVKAHLAPDLRREYALLRSARHRAILEVRECYEAEGFLVSERLDGGELFDKLARQELVGDAFAQRLVLRDVFDAVAYLRAQETGDSTSLQRG